MWRPVKEDGKCLSDEFKVAFKKRNDGGFGFIDGVYGDSIIPYLEGLKDAGIKDAQKLIDAILKYGEIRIWEEF
jgi:hypothetical protein